MVIDGLFAFYDSRLCDLYNKRIFVSVSKETFLQRKEEDLRWGDIPRWYFDHIWESYLLYGIPDFTMQEYLRVSGEVTYNPGEIIPLVTGDKG
ncbi:MAG: hypothetical protein LRY55_04400 [Leadbetterella sp.]|nr:hypothetical protein [Leadbetterella sp.]